MAWKRVGTAEQGLAEPQGSETASTGAHNHPLMTLCCIFQGERWWGPRCLDTHPTSLPVDRAAMPLLPSQAWWQVRGGAGQRGGIVRRKWWSQVEQEGTRGIVCPTPRLPEGHRRMHLLGNAWRKDLSAVLAPQLFPAQSPSSQMLPYSPP